ncbi:MAG TPA: hypothetical protein VEA35_05560 [Ramlibacter sp.]|nr:hypothetical protein [Aquabacterium sp.]HYF41899.1 hypothetical protein [Ramlibacter sp.]
MTSSTKSLRGDDMSQGSRQYLDKAGEKMRDLRYGVQDFASRGLSTVGESAAVARDRLGNYAYATRSYVAEQPVKSALIAAAVGAVVAGIVLAARRRRSYY